MLLAATRFILRQQLRSRGYIVLVTVGTLLVVGALVLSELSGGESARVIEDIGLAVIALSVSLTAVTFALSSFSREIETREIFLTLVQPLPRSMAYLSRFFAGTVSVFLANVLLGGLFIAILAAVGAPDPLGRVFIACLVGGFEAIVLLAIALFLGTGSSMAVSASVLAVLFVVGRLAHELEILVQRGVFGAMTSILDACLWVIPRLDRFDLTWWAGQTGWMSAAQAALYAGFYSLGWVLLGLVRLERRDFT
jgi:ABC-type transport system involved in multi-copper enzyme maturation permease subunit